MTLRIVIIGAGLGGLACAVSCRQNGLDVTVLEQAREISAVGAGIQVPPNAGRMLKHLGLFDKFLKTTCVLQSLDLRRYEDGRILNRRPCNDAMVEELGCQWCVSHREDYLRVLLDAAIELGMDLQLGACVERIDFDKTEVELADGRIITGDVIIGADGMWSKSRNQILGHPSEPTETGDLAYRAVFQTEQLRALRDPRVDELINRQVVTLWMGPDKHCIFYPVRSGSECNLALLRPDNLPREVSKTEGSLVEMRETFEGWDEVLTTIISCIPKVLKWKLCHHEELETWTKVGEILPEYSEVAFILNTEEQQGHVAILGDACHPTLPYQAQGAAIAIEDGVVIGHLLGKLTHDFPQDQVQMRIPSILELYETLRKKRTTLNVQGAITNRKMFHMLDGDEQIQRDKDLAEVDWVKPCPWQWCDPSYQKRLLGVDIIADCDAKYDAWMIEHRVKLNGK